jgi:hypothetical protein
LGIGEVVDGPAGMAVTARAPAQATAAAQRAKVDDTVGSVPGGRAPTVGADGAPGRCGDAALALVVRCGAGVARRARQASSW